MLVLAPARVRAPALALVPTAQVLVLVEMPAAQSLARGAPMQRKMRSRMQARLQALWVAAVMMMLVMVLLMVLVMAMVMVMVMLLWTLMPVVLLMPMLQLIKEGMRHRPATSLLHRAPKPIRANLPAQLQPLVVHVQRAPPRWPPHSLPLLLQARAKARARARARAVASEKARPWHPLLCPRRPAP